MSLKNSLSVSLGYFFVLLIFQAGILLNSILNRLFPLNFHVSRQIFPVKSPSFGVITTTAFYSALLLGLWSLETVKWSH